VDVLRPSASILGSEGPLGQMEPNFIIVPGADPLSILWQAFPELRNELDDGDSESYYIYERFADHLSSHRDDDQLWQRAYTFFESLATGGGSLQNILVVGLFEPLCADPVLAQRAKRNVGPIALKLLEDMQSFRG
jgi:hypothetical protein